MRPSPLFQGFSPEEVEEALVYFRPLPYPKGRLVFRQGDLGQALYLVGRGQVRLFRLHLGGQERTLGYVGEGEIFGEMSLLEGKERTASALTEAESLLHALYPEEYFALIRRFPLVAHNLARILAARLREADLEMDLLSFEEAKSRVAYALLKLLRQGQGPLFRLRHQELAALAGTSRETVTRALHELKALGAVRLGPGEVEVVAPELLEEVAFGLA